MPEFLERSTNKKFYNSSNSKLSALTLSGDLRTIIRPNGVLRFSEARQTLAPVNSNESASWFEYEGTAIVAVSYTHLTLPTTERV